MTENKSNLREIFDRVKTHLLTQKKRSTVNGRCFYRGALGRKCAVGCLIKDEAYTPELENKSVSHDLVVAALRVSGISFDLEDGYGKWPIDLLIDLQVIHDNTHPDYWEIKLNAMEINLFKNEK